MTLRLYDTMTHTLRDFVPVREGQVGIYLCGATVQSPPHIGHIRSGVSFDIVRRWLTHRGYDVTFIRNVTDIDDKILAKSAEAGVPWWAWAAINERAFTEAYDALGCLRPTLEPRATGHVTEMITLMQRLIDSGHAYAAAGDVYFDVASFPSYGALSGQKLDQMQAAADSDTASRKHDPRDFALWKGSRSGEPSWPTPWGDGRPGWHLECSAMAGKYLGDAFDIHGGGIDLIFPHHENEIAQSVSADEEFARYWMHNAWVTMAGEKMSKSLGNGLLVSEMVKTWRPVELRYYLGTPHYRSTIDYSADNLAAAATGYQRIETFVTNAVDLVGPGDAVTPLPKAFVLAMDEDFGVSSALASVFAAVGAGNTAIDRGDEVAVRLALAQVRAMTGILGLDPLQWAERSTSDLTSAVDTLVQIVLAQRQEARVRKDFTAADVIRGQLTAAGIDIEDTPTGARWSIRRGDADAR